MHAVLLGLAAALGTITGLFVGVPAAGFVLWPLLRTVCRVARVEIDPSDEDDRVTRLEGALAAGLGMALGVAGTVALVGGLARAPTVLEAAGVAGTVAGLTFGSRWHRGYDQHSAAPLVLVTALLAAVSAAWVAW